MCQVNSFFNNKRIIYLTIFAKSMLIKSPSFFGLFNPSIEAPRLRKDGAVGNGFTLFSLPDPKATPQRKTFPVHPASGASYIGTPASRGGPLALW